MANDFMSGIQNIVSALQNVFSSPQQSSSPTPAAPSGPAGGGAIYPDGSSVSYTNPTSPTASDGFVQYNPAPIPQYSNPIELQQQFGMPAEALNIGSYSDAYAKADEETRHNLAENYQNMANASEAVLTLPLMLGGLGLGKAAVETGGKAAAKAGGKAVAEASGKEAAKPAFEQATKNVEELVDPLAEYMKPYYNRADAFRALMRDPKATYETMREVAKYEAQKGLPFSQNAYLSAKPYVPNSSLQKSAYEIARDKRIKQKAEDAWVENLLASEQAQARNKDILNSILW